MLYLSLFRTMMKFKLTHASELKLQGGEIRIEDECTL